MTFRSGDLSVGGPQRGEGPPAARGSRAPPVARPTLVTRRRAIGGGRGAIRSRAGARFGRGAPRRGGTPCRASQARGPAVAGAGRGAGIIAKASRCGSGSLVCSRGGPQGVRGSTFRPSVAKGGRGPVARRATRLASSGDLALSRAGTRGAPIAACGATTSGPPRTEEGGTSRPIRGRGIPVFGACLCTRPVATATIARRAACGIISGLRGRGARPATSSRPKRRVARGP